MLYLRQAAAVYRLLRNLPLGFISFVMGAFLVTQAFAATGIGGAALMLLLWVIFGHFLGAPPCIGALASREYWDDDELFGVLFVQGFMFVGLMWFANEAFPNDLGLWLMAASGINGLLMAPAMVKEKKDQISSNPE